MRSILVLILLMISSCNHWITDPNLAVREANYPSLEIRTSDGLHNGLAIVEYDKLTPSLLSVQGYFKGSLRIVSDSCGINQNIGFAKTRLITLPGIADFSSCIFHVVMSYDPPKPDEAVIHPLYGIVAVYKKDSFEGLNLTKRIASGSIWFFVFEFFEDVKIKFLGCGANDIGDFENINGKINIEMDKFVNLKDARTCILKLGVKGQNHKRKVRVLLNIFDSRFVPLAIPSLEWKKKSLKITATDYVSMISVNNKYKIGQKKSFKYKLGHTVRLLTSKGRLLIGTIKNQGVIEWNQ